VKVPKVSSLTLEQWVAEYQRLKKVNEEILREKVGSETAPRKATNARSRKKN
jgi:hypothetical protein